MRRILRTLRPRSPHEAHRDLGDRKRDARAWGEAADAYEAFLKHSPSDFSIWVQLGNCSKEAGRFAAAEKAYRTAISLNERDVDVRVQLGHLFKLQKRKSEALKAYESAAALAPDHADARHEIESLLGRARQDHGALTFETLEVPAKSLDELLRGLSSDPKRSDVFRRYFNDFVPN